MPISSLKSLYNESSVPKGTIALFLILGLSACATPIRTVTSYTSDNCVNYQKTAFNEKNKEGEVGALLESITENVGFNDRCATHQMLVKLTQDNSELGMISKVALLKMVADYSPEDKKAIVAALLMVGSSLEKVQSDVDVFTSSANKEQKKCSLIRNTNGVVELHCDGPAT